MEILKSILILILALQIAECNGQIAEPEIKSLPITKSLLSNAIVSEGNQTSLQSVFSRAHKGGKLVIGVFGGSITEGAACANPSSRYPNVVLAWWKKTFPKAQVELVNAGIGATGSDYGAMRVKRDLLSHSPDMVVVDFAVNDPSTKEYAESYEGVVRQILNAPKKPALMLLFMMKSDGTNAQELESKIGTYYGVPMISYRDAIWPEIQTGKIKWSEISPDNIHPNEIGHKLTGELICGALDRAFRKFSLRNNSSTESSIIPTPLLSDSFEFTSLFDGETLVPVANQNWVFDNSQKRSTGWKSSNPGSVIEFEISGKLIYLSCWKIKGPMGKISTSIDGEGSVIMDAWFDQTWGGYRYMLPIGKNLKPGKHIVCVELLLEKNTQSTGNEFRILCLGSAGI